MAGEFKSGIEGRFCAREFPAEEVFSDAKGKDGEACVV
jgi:hypothetical protein